MENPVIQRLVERRMREWELAGTVAQRECTPIAASTHPYVALTRTLGSGGREVADRLGDALGWPVYDKEILDYMAEADEVQRRLYASTDECTATWLELMTAPFRAEAPQRRDDYFHKLVRAVRTIASQSSAIFVGRGAGFILPADCGLHVRLVAPFDRCVQNYAARSGVEVSEAATVVRATNAARAKFLRDRFGEDAAAIERFDLVIQTGRIRPPDAAELIAVAARTKLGLPEPQPISVSFA